MQIEIIHLLELQNQEQQRPQSRPKHPSLIIEEHSLEMVDAATDRVIKYKENSVPPGNTTRVETASVMNTPTVLIRNGRHSSKLSNKRQRRFSTYT